jgi:D-aminopeptidase
MDKWAIVPATTVAAYQEQLTPEEGTSIWMQYLTASLCCLAVLLRGTIFALAQELTRLRARDMGVPIGVLPTGPLNTISDVAGVLVGQAIIVRGDNIRTGVTAILPHGGNLLRETVPGAIFVGNAFRKLAGST